MNFLRNFGQLCRRFSCQNLKKTVQVCLLGADTPSGQATTFLLKQNPRISVLHLQGSSKVEVMGLDLSHFDTLCKVQTYYGYTSVNSSIKAADIVIILGLNTCETKLTLPKLVMAEGARLAKLAQACSRYAPKAIIIVNVNPISVMLPLVGEIYRKTPWYHPGRLLGSTALVQIKANALAGHFQNLDPQMVHVPIVGGPDLDTALPLFGRTSPCGMTRKDAEKLLKEFRKEIMNPSVSVAVGLNRIVTGIAMGICGDNSARILAHVRTNIISTCQHMVSTVKVGKGGIVHNYGLEKLSRHELALFEELALILKQREEMANEFVNRSDKCALPAFVVKEMEEEKSLKQGVIR